MACIIALDGFYMDGRNIRASYGTSKYCSAFIKNIKCSNPDCTYLHSMGEAEDTFSKQEIQAGYVTSGRDVLARQQQLAAAFANSTSRKKVGGGGPSGTGRIAPNPIFPPPTYEEPHRSSQTLTMTTIAPSQFPPGSQHSFSRSNSSITTAGFSNVVANGPLPKASKSQSLSAIDSIPINESDDDDILECDEVNNPTFTSTDSNSISHPHGILFKGDVSSTGDEPLVERRSSLPSNMALHTPSTTAASIVAGSHTVSKSVTLPSLTTLTPLKRASSLTSTSSSVAALGLTKSSGSASTYNPHVQDTSILSGSNSDVLKTTLSSSEDDSYVRSNIYRNVVTLSPSSSISSNGPTSLETSKILHFNEPELDTNIGGAVIGSNGTNSFPLFPSSAATAGTFGVAGPINSFNAYSGAAPIHHTSTTNQNVSSNSFNGNEIRYTPTSSYLGSFSFDSDINPETGVSLGSLSGSTHDRISSHGITIQQNGRDNSIPIRTSMPSAIGPPPQHNRSNNSGVIGGGRSLIGGTTIAAPIAPSGLTGGNFLNLGQNTSSGSSILASMLGIELPTGTGSLRDSLWDPTPSQITPSISSSKASIQPPPPIGSGIKAGGDVILGRGSSIPMTNPKLHASSSVVGGGRNSTDIALLQSLLPGVHITSGSVANTTSPINSTPWLAAGNNNTSIFMDRPLTGNIHPPSLPMHSQYSQPLQPRLQQQQNTSQYEPWGNLPMSSSGNAPQLNPSTQPNFQQYSQQGHLPNIW